MCCCRQARHQQALPGALGKAATAGSKVHQHGTSGS